MLQTYGTSEWFENIFRLSDDDPWGHNWRAIEQYRYHVIIEMIKKHIPIQPKMNNQLRVLDIGCSTGDFTNRLYQLNKNVIGIDISETAIKRAKTKFNHIDFRIDSLPNSRLINNTFDFITCLEVLYYMDTNKQTVFLTEMNNLLKNHGKALVTSKIGQEPYFKPKKLINLLSQNFEIKAVEYYGFNIYSLAEKILFNKYRQIRKIQILLTSDCQELEKKFINLNNQRKKIVKNIIRLVIRFTFLKLIVHSFLEILSNKIKMILGWKFLANVFNFISRKMSLSPTHTFVLVSKSGK